MCSLERLAQYHSRNRVTFIMLAEMIAFVGVFAGMMTIGFVRDLLS